MNDELLVTAVHSRTSGVQGRSLNAARRNHFVIDASGDQAEAVTPGEAFLSGLSACGVLMLERVAAERDVPLAVADAWIEGVRPRSDPTWYQRVDLRFRLEGPTREQAEDLVEYYRSH
ncbi:MAG TPA: OsmC family protein [Terriglobales bacterium]|nr:OsmC family protein [Terriglobales bacterium]